MDRRGAANGLPERRKVDTHVRVLIVEDEEYLADAVWAEFASAERFLLEYPPRTAAEAVQILSIIVEQGGDGRSDGRDVEALSRVRRFLQQVARIEEAQAASAMRAA